MLYNTVSKRQDKFQYAVASSEGEVGRNSVPVFVHLVYVHRHRHFKTSMLAVLALPTRRQAAVASPKHRYNGG